MRGCNTNVRMLACRFDRLVVQFLPGECADGRRKRILSSLLFSALPGGGRGEGGREGEGTRLT